MNWIGLGDSFQLFVGYVIMAIVVTSLAVHFTKLKYVKWVVGFACVSVFYGMTRIDDYLGGNEHRMLCKKYAVTKVYKQAYLPQKFYDTQGNPKFIDQQGGIYEPSLEGYIKFTYGGKDSYSNRYVKIDKTIYAISDVRSGKLLGEMIDFIRWPSPFVPTFVHSKAVGCVKSPEEIYKLKEKFRRKIFPKLTNNDRESYERN